MDATSEQWRFRAVSFVIVMVLGLQLFAVLARTSKGWPFTDYPMYAVSSEEGDRVPVESTLYATFADGAEAPVTPKGLGLGDAWWMYKIWVRDPLRGESRRSRGRPLEETWRANFVDPDNLPNWAMGDRKSPERALAFVLQRYDRLQHKKIVKLRLEDAGVIVTRHGMEKVPPETVWTWSASSDDDGADK